VTLFDPEPGKPRSPLSRRAYARHRGVSHTAVNLAIAGGRLKACLDADGNIADAVLADQEWDANTDLTKAPTAVRERAEERRAAVLPPAGDVETLPEATRREKVAKANMAELQLAEAAGELVPAAEVRGKLVDVFGAVRTKLLGIPSKIRQTDSSTTPAQLATFETLIREALEGLAIEGMTT
jgi:phage terminase Nu1 subunit (DNA packaging protein)